MSPDLGLEAPELAALDDLILGRGVKRGQHELAAIHQERVLTRLPELGFQKVLVADVEIEIGARVPAWVLRTSTLEFGMIFWEVFTPRAKRKLFACERRNAKGDWAVQIPAGSKEHVHANLALLERYDASRPVGMY